MEAAEWAPFAALHDQLERVAAGVVIPTPDDADSLEGFPSASNCDSISRCGDSQLGAGYGRTGHDHPR